VHTKAGCSQLAGLPLIGLALAEIKKKLVLTIGYNYQFLTKRHAAQIV